jgi:hypothetical protein
VFDISLEGQLRQDNYDKDEKYSYMKRGKYELQPPLREEPQQVSDSTEAN